MRALLPVRVLRSAWVYLLIAFAVLVVVGGLMLRWSYDTNDWVRFHVQEALAQVHSLTYTQPNVVPTPSFVAAAPTFAPTPSPLPPTAAPATSTQAHSGPTTTAVLQASSTAIPPTAVPTATQPALPSHVALTGFHFEYQGYNNCGPTTLAIDLSYWGWKGGQKTAAPALKPDPDDKNVSPAELYQYALTVGYDAYIRVNGNVDDIRRFVAAGYPVVVEKGFTCTNKDHCTGWFGHYSTVSGYDDANGYFTLQDSYFGPNFKMTYTDFVANWRAFNYLYIVFFPAGSQHDSQVSQLLGGNVDVNKNYHDALARAQQEALTSTGEAQAFAWFNVGTNLHSLQDYAGAAAAYDQARQIGLPYRMLWYQFGPYLAYYYMARYQDVVDLATFAINSVTTVPGLEEAYYWRGQAEESIGQPDAAVTDYKTAVQRHAGYKPAIDALTKLGLTP
jgi:tetratricopeptide (TPR) repeat protein